MPTYRGGCHCGAVQYEVDGEIADLSVCNCSICSKTAYIHWQVPPESFRLLTPEEAIETYEFGTRTAKHWFCRTCGISSFRRSRTRPECIDVNVRCLQGVDAERFETSRFDGRNWERAAGRR
ncbi:MAG TPA: GFA family protein [Myxococcota bacterium]